MEYLLDGADDKFPSWRDYFDVAITSAGKPVRHHSINILITYPHEYVNVVVFLGRFNVSRSWFGDWKTEAWPSFDRVSASQSCSVSRRLTVVIQQIDGRCQYRSFVHRRSHFRRYHQIEKRSFLAHSTRAARGRRRGQISRTDASVDQSIAKFEFHESRNFSWSRFEHCRASKILFRCHHSNLSTQSCIIIARHVCFASSYPFDFKSAWCFVFGVLGKSISFRVNCDFDMKKEKVFWQKHFFRSAKQTHFSLQVERFADLYTGSFLNLRNYPLFYQFTSSVSFLPHEFEKL